MKQIKIELYEQQDDFVHDDSMHTGFIAGIGSGKTFSGAVKGLRCAKRGTLGMVVAPTFGMLRDSTFRTFMELAEPFVLKVNRTDFSVLLRNGAEILWRSADDPEKLRGPNLHWGWIDEGGLCRKGTWDILIGRLRASGEVGKSFVTTTPKGRLNWVYEASKKMKLYRATTLDNPYVSQEWKNNLLENYSGMFLQQEVYGEFVQFEGLVYPMFDQSIHVVKQDLTLYNEVGIGFDEGYNNPMVLLKIYSGDGCYHIAEEYYETGKLQSDVIQAAVEMVGSVPMDLIGDPAASGLVAGFRNAGLRAYTRASRVLDGIKLVQDLLKVKKNGKPRLTIDPSCVRTIAEFETYAWKEGTDEVIKDFDHAMDALRYYVVYPKQKMAAQQTKYGR